MRATSAARRLRRVRIGSMSGCLSATAGSRWWCRPAGRRRARGRAPRRPAGRRRCGCRAAGTARRAPASAAGSSTVVCGGTAASQATTSPTVRSRQPAGSGRAKDDGPARERRARGRPGELVLQRLHLLHQRRVHDQQQQRRRPGRRGAPPPAPRRRGRMLAGLQLGFEPLPHAGDQVLRHGGLELVGGPRGQPAREGALGAAAIIRVRHGHSSSRRSRPARRCRAK